MSRNRGASFGKIFAAAFAAFMLVNIIQGIFYFIYFKSAMSFMKSSKTVLLKDNYILKLNLSGKIVERGKKSDFKLKGVNVPFVGDDLPTLGLNDIVLAIKNAAKDDKIKGIVVYPSAFASGFATDNSIYEALQEFKKSGKFLYAYSHLYTEKGLFLASIADSVFLYPEGFVEWNGLGKTSLHFRGLLDKLGVEPIELRMGKYKSAVEPYAYKKMSAPSKQQYKELLFGIWNYIVGKIAENRKTEASELQQLASQLDVELAESALKYKLVDKLIYPDEFEELLRKKTGTEEDEKIPFVSIKKYANYVRSNLETKKDKIAVIYAVGPIRMGEGDHENIGEKTLVKAIRKARKDKNIKAIVLRVNSPGGSALASDIIAREIALAKKTKPVLASYGDLAASGGYYISALCDSIFAEPTTITGSIGVIGLLLNYQKLLNHKLGITTDTVKTNPYADLASPTRPLTKFEKEKIMKVMHDIYGDFISVVQKGRGFKDSLAVDSIGQGRVWLATAALKIHLVDRLASLDEAIQSAAKKAGIEEYSLVEFPKFKSPLEKLMEDLLSTRSENPFQYLIKKYIAQFNDPRNVYMRDFAGEEILSGK